VVDIETAPRRQHDCPRREHLNKSYPNLSSIYLQRGPNGEITEYPVTVSSLSEPKDTEQKPFVYEPRTYQLKVPLHSHELHDSIRSMSTRPGSRDTLQRIIFPRNT